MFDDMDKGVKLSSEAEEDEEALKTKDECGMSPSTPNVGKVNHLCLSSGWRFLMSAFPFVHRYLLTYFTIVNGSCNEN